MKKTKRVKKEERLLKGDQLWRNRTYIGISNSTGVESFYTAQKFTLAEIKELLKEDFWIKACVNTIVDEVIKYPLKADIEEGVKANDYLIKQKNKLNAFLKYPSDKEPLFIVRKKYLKDMLIYGNGVCLIDFKNGVPSRLRAVPGYSVAVTIDKDPPTYKFIDIKSLDFLTDKNGKVIELPIDQVMHFQLEADSDALVAYTPLNPLYYHFGTDIELIKKVFLTAKAGGMLPAMMSVERANEKTFKLFLKWVNKEFENGASIAGLNKKTTVTELPHWTATQTLEVFRWMGMCIATVYKVPPFMLNLVENTGSLNAREQYSRFLENVIEPILKYEKYLYSLILAKKAFKMPKIEVNVPLIATKLNYARARVARTLTTKDTEIFTVDEIRKIIFGVE